MKVSQKIEQNIEKIEVGTTFRYQDLLIERKEYNAAAKALERMIKKGLIKRIATGIFYKPKQTVFGEIIPKEEELLKPYLFDNGKRIAYITGLSLYNRMGLTTQIPKTIKIASRDKRIFASVGNLKGKPVKSYVDVTDDNFYLLEVLDAIKDFKNIPDIDKKAGILLLTEKLKNLDNKEIAKIIKSALKYPPRTMALLGAMLELIPKDIDLDVLKEGLNPLTQYDYKISEDTLANAINWNIK